MNKQNTQQDSRLQEAWLEDCTDFRHAQTCQGLKQQMICFLYDKSPHILADIKLRDNSSCLIQIIERQKYQRYFTCAPFTFPRQSRTIPFHHIAVSPLSFSFFPLSPLRFPLQRFRKENTPTSDIRITHVLVLYISYYGYKILNLCEYIIIITIYDSYHLYSMCGCQDIFAWAI